jgi:hypothetical protein
MSSAANRGLGKRARPVIRVPTTSELGGDSLVAVQWRESIGTGPCAHCPTARRSRRLPRFAESAQRRWTPTCRSSLRLWRARPMEEPEVITAKWHDEPRASALSKSGAATEVVNQ